MIDPLTPYVGTDFNLCPMITTSEDEMNASSNPGSHGAQRHEGPNHAVHAGHHCSHGHGAGPQTVTDPVCGMNVDPQSAAGAHAHEGSTYYFCSARCLEQFKADPAKYFEPKDAVKLPPAPTGAQYTCPMHPEIVRNAPGDCPICGMALVPIAGTGASDDTELRDLTRRFGREHQVLIGVRLLSGTISANRAGEFYARLADILIRAVHRWVEARFALIHGKLAKSESAVVALGAIGDQAAIPDLMKLVADGALSPLIGATFPLRDAAQAAAVGAVAAKSAGGRVETVTSTCRLSPSRVWRRGARGSRKSLYRPH